MWRLYKTTYDPERDEPMGERVMIIESEKDMELTALKIRLDSLNPTPRPTARPYLTRPYVTYTVEH